MPARANTLDDAWSNFDPRLPLESGSPFYVSRPGDPLSEFIHALLQEKQPPKYFFAGHRGSGKSTELNRLAESPAIQMRFLPVKFSVFEVCDVNNLSYVDVLLAIGAQMYVGGVSQGCTLDRNLVRELDGWKGQVVERLQAKGAVFEGGAGIDLSQFFLATLLKIKTEHSTRESIRQVIEPRLSELIEKINLIAAGIQASGKRQVLVIIDDLDKPPLEQARKLFYDAYAPMTQPACAIVYTVPVAILFSDAFMAIRESSVFLPNVKLHQQGQREQRAEAGYATMREFVLRRMDESLITRPALQSATRLSGGVFREMAYLMRTAITNARRRGATRVEQPDVAWAESQLRNPLMRLLSDEDFALLRRIRDENPHRLPDPAKHARLLHILAVLQYANAQEWFDVHPTLVEVLSEG